MPDSQKWAYEIGYIRNQELQYYTENRYENARAENGNLIIEARKENYQGYAYTSASIHMKEEQILYGRVEVRAKLPTGRGTWPAIWMLGTNMQDVGWPASGEIDLMENVGFDPNQIHMSIHTPAYNHILGTAKTTSITVTNPSDTYHVYAIEWYKDRIDFFVDDAKVFTYENDGKGPDTWPFDKPQYLLINLAIGGSWGGEHGVDDSIFPQRFYVDYVRVYQACP